MNCSREAAGFARFADGKWEPICTTSTDEVRTIEIGGNSPMPVYLYAALVTDLASYMREELVETLWKNFPYSMYSAEAERNGRDLR